jgi:hypothetical protein
MARRWKLSSILVRHQVGRSGDSGMQSNGWRRPGGRVHLFLYSMSALTHVTSLTSSCQCGVSRSATLVIAYIMSLAVAGLLPDQLGHLKGMQDTYDMVKARSPSIGPNVS